MQRYDLVIVGAGPCGLSTAVEAKKRGIYPLVIDKGCVVNSIYRYPTFMQFFSTPELLEIGELPFICGGEKPLRPEALKYYRAVVKAYDLCIRSYEEVTSIQKKEGQFTLTTNCKGKREYYQASNVVIATGYYDNPNLLQVPGEDLEKVSHYYKESHPYAGQEVLIVGGKNSAVDAALDLYHGGAKVTMIYRREAFTDSVKAWVKPVIESAIEKGWITMYWNTTLCEIRDENVIVDQLGQRFTLKNDAVFAMTGYYPKTKALTQLGVRVNQETGAPLYEAETMETEVPGLYIAGVIAAGRDANRIFIENGRYHGPKIATDLARKREKKGRI